MGTLPRTNRKKNVCCTQRCLPWLRY